jgi:hypothetical protein
MLTTRLRWLLWIAAAVLWLAVWMYPVSTGSTRLAGLILFVVLWLGLIALTWRHRAWRAVFLSVSVAVSLFLIWPGKTTIDRELLRAAYLRGMARYSGVHYFWGGESPKGIDCSGLMRRGMIDGLFLEGCRHLNPAMVRLAFDLWWHDCTAKDFMDGYRGFTWPVLTTPSLNALDHTRIAPGDMAVTNSGLHILAYAGDQHWIEADPHVGQVVTVTAPAPGNAWFTGPMKIVRWQLLE